MKKSGFYLSVLFLLTSCQSPTHRERIIRTDTVYGLTGLDQFGNLVLYNKAIVAVIERRSLPTDSTSSSVEWKTDTVCIQAYTADSLRDANGKPVFDSVRNKYKFDTAWRPFRQYDPKTVWIKYFPALKHP